MPPVSRSLDTEDCAEARPAKGHVRGRVEEAGNRDEDARTVGRKLVLHSESADGSEAWDGSCGPSA